MDFAVDQGWNREKLRQCVDFVGLRNSTAFVLVLHGRVVIEKYWGGRQQGNVSDVYSVAKSVVALLVCQAEKEGLVDTSQTVSKLMGQSGWSRASKQRYALHESSLQEDFNQLADAISHIEIKFKTVLFCPNTPYFRFPARIRSRWRTF